MIDLEEIAYTYCNGLCYTYTSFIDDVVNIACHCLL